MCVSAVGWYVFCFGAAVMTEQQPLVLLSACCAGWLLLFGPLLLLFVLGHFPWAVLGWHSIAMGPEFWCLLLDFWVIAYTMLFACFWFIRGFIALIGLFAMDL
jgi:hypothetical protein